MNAWNGRFAQSISAAFKLKINGWQCFIRDVKNEKFETNLGIIWLMSQADKLCLDYVSRIMLYRVIYFGYNHDITMARSYF